MQQPKVSVVIPVHNAEPFVEEALRSIMNQTLRELEIIAVDDGSSDGSLAVLKRLSGEDSRIRVVEQANLGVSEARNAGVQCSKGEYIYFIDSDDWLEASALEECYSKSNAEQLDFLFFDADSFAENNWCVPPQDYCRTSGMDETVYRGADMLRIQLEKGRYRAPVWLCFIRREYILRISLSFYPGIIHEDQLYTAILYLQASRTAFIPKAFCKHRICMNSIMSKDFSWENLDGYFTVARELKKFSKKQPEEISDIITLFLMRMLDAVVRWHAYKLTLIDKIKIWFLCLGHGYAGYVPLRSWLVLFFKSGKKVIR